MTSITVNVPAAVSVPRGAVLVGTLYSAVTSRFALWRAARTQRRAAASRAAEVKAVRIYAWNIMHEDQRFAADLLAAADRHESTV